MTQQSFETPGQVTLRVDNKAGPVEVRTHPSPTTEVEVISSGGSDEKLAEQTRVEHSSSGGRDHIDVEIPTHTDFARFWQRRGGVAVRVVVPEGASFDIRTASGDVTGTGRFGSAHVDTASGRVAVERVDGDLRVNTASGDVRLGSVGADATIHTASGDVECDVLERGGRIQTASGDVAVRDARSELSVRTASGDVTTGSVVAGCRFRSASGDQNVGRIASGLAQLDTVTGDVTVAIAPGSVVAVDAGTVSGSLSTEIDLDDDDPAGAGSSGAPRVELRARTVSGDVHIRRAG